MSDPSFAPRISLVTLGVADVARATAFYAALGWPLSTASVPGEVSFFRTAGAILALWGSAELARDSHADGGTPAGYRAVALAVNLDSTAEVDAAMSVAAAAGATVLKPPAGAEWGGYQGYFADPDGHVWEVAYNPFWPTGPDGLPVLP